MPIRFRKTIKIGPGLKLNLSKGGVSFTIGKKGYHINIGKHGVKQTVGIPGTGISHMSYLGKDDDDERKSGEKDEGLLGGLGGVAGMAALATAMSDDDNDKDKSRDKDDEDDDRGTKARTRSRNDEDSEPETQTRRKRARKQATARKDRSSLLGSIFILLSAMVFLVVGAGVLGLIPGDFVNNLGHAMVQWAMQFGQ